MQANKEKSSVETELAERQRALSAIEQERIQATNDKKALEQESGGVKKDIQDAEMNIQKIEQEKTNRDHVIKSLNDEIAYQDEIINKLNKEKKHITENSSKSVEDLQTVDDKVQHLHKVKEKLECTLDELEASAEKEKRTRTAVEKERRKLELDLKLLQETVADLERSRKELEAMIGRKEVDVSAARTKLNDEQSLVGKVSNNIIKVKLYFHMKHYLLSRFKSLSRSTSAASRCWRRSLRPRGRRGPTRRGSGLTWRGRWRTCQSGSIR